MQKTAKVGIIALAMLFLTIPLLAACGGGDDDEGQTAAPTAPATGQPTAPPTQKPTEKVTITIGNLTDVTGASAAAHEVINMALDDLVEYYNENDLIPGVELKVITYDQQLDPSRDIPGYEWLREKGADVIFTGNVSTPVTLKPRLDKDKFVLFAATANPEDLVPPGYLFSVGSVSRNRALTLLKWIAENDWDYGTKGPAKIGYVDWDSGNAQQLEAALKEYCQVHPDQFEWIGGHLAPVSTFSWGPEVEAVKDCDYVWPPTIMLNFVKEYRSAGHAAKLMGVDDHLAFISLIDDANMWDEIDEMLFIKASRWWNDEGELIDQTKKILFEKHPDSAEGIMRQGVGYIAMENLFMVVDIIAGAVEAVGPENFDSETLYEAAQSYAPTIDGIEGFWSFGAAKRYANNYQAMYEARAADKTVFRLHTEWLPLAMEP